MNRSSRAFRATLVNSIFGYTAQGLSVIAIPLYLSTLGAEGYGLMVTVLSFMGYFSFADAGLSWGSMVLIAHAHGRSNKAEIAHIVRHAILLAAG
jgi:O-antigen/teichoic acid export membrane protein